MGKNKEYLSALRSMNATLESYFDSKQSRESREIFVCKWFKRFVLEKEEIEKEAREKEAREKEDNCENLCPICGERKHIHIQNDVPEVGYDKELGVLFFGCSSCGKVWCGKR